MCSVLLCEVRERRQAGLGEYKETCGILSTSYRGRRVRSRTDVFYFEASKQPRLDTGVEKSGETSKLINLHVQKKNKWFNETGLVTSEWTPLVIKKWPPHAPRRPDENQQADYHLRL